MSEPTARIPLAAAIRMCETLYTLVPWPNQWQGSEYEQLIFGKGMVAGAKACAEALRQWTTGCRSSAGTENAP